MVLQVWQVPLGQGAAARVRRVYDDGVNQVMGRFYRRLTDRYLTADAEGIKGKERGTGMTSCRARVAHGQVSRRARSALCLQRPGDAPREAVCCLEADGNQRTCSDADRPLAESQLSDDYSNTGGGKQRQRLTSVGGTPVVHRWQLSDRLCEGAA